MQVNVNGTFLNYEILNPQLLDKDRVVLVFLHDGLGSIGQWKDIPQKLCELMKLAGIVYERNGYGMSYTENKYFEKDYLQYEAKVCLPEFLASLGIQNKMILFGHSDGASIALLFATYFPQKVIAIISEAAHVFVEEITVAGIKKLRHDYLIKKALSKNLKKYHKEHTDQLFNAWTTSWLSAEFRNWNIESLLTGITVPVLAIQGEEDEFGSKLQLESIQKNANASVEMHFIPDCSHFPHFEKEEDVLKMIRDFIKRILQAK